jgi:ElaB/YqjD/DUF883 family membrane-anchored ribosome-binding protein
MRTTEQDDVSRQLAKLREDILALTEAMAALAHERADQVKSQLHGAAEDAVRNASAATRHALGDASKFGDGAIKTAEEFAGQLEEYIKRKPLTSVTAAVGIGFLLGLMRRR